MLRIWDCLFNEGSKIIFRVALTLIKQHQAFILEATSVADICERFKEITRGSFVTECHTFMQVSVWGRLCSAAPLARGRTSLHVPVPSGPPPRWPPQPSQTHLLPELHNSCPSCWAASPMMGFRAAGTPMGPVQVHWVGAQTRRSAILLEPFPCCWHLWFRMALLGPSRVARVCCLSYPEGQLPQPDPGPGTGV